MTKASAFALLFALAGCSALPPAQYSSSPCDAGEARMACQIERYNNVSQ